MITPDTLFQADSLDDHFWLTIAGWLSVLLDQRLLQWRELQGHQESKKGESHLQGQVTVGQIFYMRHVTQKRCDMWWKTCDLRHLTLDTWYFKCDTSHDTSQMLHEKLDFERVTCDMVHVTCEMRQMTYYIRRVCKGKDLWNETCDIWLITRLIWSCPSLILESEPQVLQL